MLYDLTLRDLSIVGSSFGVSLRLYGCKEVQLGAKVNRPDSFVGYMGYAKYIGYQIIALGLIPTINAVEPPDYEHMSFSELVADVDVSEMRPDDIMSRVANEYDTHQFMREAIRETLVHNVPRSSGAKLEALHRDMCLLSLWMALHDPDFANGMRQRMLDSFKAFNHAVLSVACSKKLAYVRDIGPRVVNLTKALRHADNSVGSSIIEL